MGQLTRTALKANFETADTPTEAQFADNFDSQINILDDLGGNQGIIRNVALLIPTAQVLTLNSLPVQIIPAPGAGFAIQVISGFIHIIFNTAAYTINVSPVLQTATTNTSQFNLVSGLAATIDAIKLFQKSFGLSGTATQLLDNQALNVSEANGDPAVGDSDIKIFVTYRNVAL